MFNKVISLFILKAFAVVKVILSYCVEAEL